MITILNTTGIKMWWERNLPVLKLRLIVVGIIIFIVIPWIIGICIYVHLLFKII